MRDEPRIFPGNRTIWSVRGCIRRIIWRSARPQTNTTFRTCHRITSGGPLGALSRRHYRSEAATLLVTLPLVSGCAGDGPDTAERGSVGTSATEWFSPLAQTRAAVSWNRGSVYIGSRMGTGEWERERESGRASETDRTSERVRENERESKRYPQSQSGSQRDADMSLGFATSRILLGAAVLPRFVRRPVSSRFVGWTHRRPVRRPRISPDSRPAPAAPRPRRRHLLPCRVVRGRARRHGDVRRRPLAGRRDESQPPGISTDGAAVQMADFGRGPVM